MPDNSTIEINLFLVQNPTAVDYIKITREDQWRALLPHPLKHKYPSLSIVGSGKNSENISEMKFTPVEAKVRDTI
jgi:hypothetical protein